MKKEKKERIDLENANRNKSLLLMQITAENFAVSHRVKMADSFLPDLKYRRHLSERDFGFIKFIALSGSEL